MSKTTNRPAIKVTTGFNDFAARGERSAATRTVAVAEPVATPQESDSGERGFMRPSHDVRVAEHANNAVRIKSATRLTPGMRTDLQLLDQRRTLRGEIDRCRVSRLEPLCYEAIFVFDQAAEMPETKIA